LIAQSYPFILRESSQEHLRIKSRRAGQDYGGKKNKMMVTNMSMQRWEEKKVMEEWPRQLQLQAARCPGSQARRTRTIEDQVTRSGDLCADHNHLAESEALVLCGAALQPEAGRRRRRRSGRILE